MPTKRKKRWLTNHRFFRFCDQTKKDTVDRIQKASSLVVRFWGHIVVSDRIESQVNAIVDVLR